MERLALVVALASLPGAAVPAVAETRGREEKAAGYLEYRDGPALIVDGQRVLIDGATRTKLEDEAKTLASIPLGYEVKVRGVRQADGSLLAAELEAKKHGSAMFQEDVRKLTDEAESEYRRAGRYFSHTADGGSETVGALSEEGARVERVGRVVDSLLPSYIDPGQVRVYVIDNREWNAFAMGNYSIYVFSGLLDGMDDDELAIILGHELAHATHEHTRRQFKKEIVSGAGAWQSGYGRDLEDQADRVGLRYAYEAGYDISKGPRLWERFARKHGEPGAATHLFGSHSTASQRAVNLQRQIALNYPNGPKDSR